MSIHLTKAHEWGVAPLREVPVPQPVPPSTVIPEGPPPPLHQSHERAYAAIFERWRRQGDQSRR